MIIIDGDHRSRSVSDVQIWLIVSIWFGYKPRMKDDVFTSGLLSTESVAEAFINTEPALVDSFR